MALLAFALLSPLSLRAAVAGATATIVFEVRDKVTGAPIQLSGVILVGPLRMRLLSDKDGNATFADVPPGKYTATVGAPRYARVNVPEFDVPEGETRVTVSLVSTSLKVIGTSVARRGPKTSATAVDASSALRKLSIDQLDAIGRLPAVELQQSVDENGEPSSQVAIEGHPPGQTGASIDGLPILSAKLAGDIVQYAPDLFAGARVSFDPRAGAVAGTLDFSTINPSLYWRGEFSGTTGANDFGLATYSVNGSYHGIGLAAVHAVRGNENRLSGDRYDDASGLDYTHRGSNLRTSSLVKLQKLLGDRGSLSILAVDATRAVELICGDRINPIPCGFGPGNSFSGGFSYRQAELDYLLGAITIRANGYHARTTTGLDLSHRLLAGTSEPLTFRDAHSAGGYTINAFTIVGRHTLSLLQAGLTESDHVLSAFSGVRLQAASQSHDSSTTLTDTYDFGKAVATPTLGRTQFGAATGTDSSLAVRYRASTNEDFAIVGSVTRQSSPSALIPFVPDAAGLRYYCDSGVAVGSGPTSFGGTTRADSVRTTYSRRWGADGEIDVSAYAQHQADIAIYIPINGALFPRGTFTDQFLAAAAADSDISGACGSSRTYAPSNLFFRSLTPGVDVVYRGYRANGVLPLGALTAQWQIGVQDGVIARLPLAASGPDSVERVGDQIPTVPHLTYGLTLDYKRPRSFVEWLAAVHGFGANNRYSAHGVAALDLALSAQLRHGTLTGRINNLNVDPGNDFTSLGGVALQSPSGLRLPILAVPRDSRSVSFTYTQPLGDAFRRQAGRGRDLVATRSSSDDKVTLALPSAAPTDAFRIRNGSATCSLERAQRISPFLSELERFTKSLKPVDGSYPNTPSVALPRAGGFAVHYRSLGATYALAIYLNNFAQLQPWISCVRLHQATEAEVAERHLYGSPVGFEGVPFYFMPEVGIYNIAPSARLVPFRRYALSVPNPAPFALSSSGSCGVYFHTNAVELLALLERALGHDGIVVGDYGRFSVQKLSNEVYSLRFKDPQDLATALNCAHVSAGTRAELTAAKLAADPLPSVNYSRAIGIFVISSDDGKGDAGT